ncbi:MAG TPA: DUF4012 domain-containing protein [Mycobacteriales bacterium]|nr:DUF4012 domain-containing protein [Mycobacteriales bacterium]
MDEQPRTDGQFRILVVCTGNVCRSPLAERIIRARLVWALGAGADRFTVTSAGTEPLTGLPMDPRAARAAGALGADVEGFAAREVTPADVAAADLVLTASRAHRASAVRMHPRAHRYAFTILEFSRLAGVLPAALSVPGDGGTPGTPSTGSGNGTAEAAAAARADDAVRRARMLVARAAALRGTVRPRRPEDDDVADPIGGAGQVHRTVGTVIADALAGPLEVITGMRFAGSGRSLAGTRSTASVHSGPVATTQPLPEPSGPALARGPSKSPGPSARRRWLVWAAAGAVVAALLGAGWLTMRAVRAEGELGRARAGMSTMRADLLSGHLSRARAALADVTGHTGRARRLTTGPLWRLAAAPPFLGNTARAVRAAAAATDDVSRRVLPPLVDLSASLDPAALRPSGDTVAVDRFAAIAPVAHAVSTELATVRTRVDRVSRSWLLPPVASGLGRLRTELAGASSTLDSIDRAAQLVPAMLGADGPRHYLVAFQNDAEARGTGGLVGLYAVVSADHGRVHVDELGSDTALQNAPDLPVDLGREFRTRWGDDPAMWANSNMDPKFGYAARIWLALWDRQTGRHLDGVIATDPVALGYLLGAIGPVRLSTGDAMTASNAVALTMSEVYARFPDSNEQRDAYMRDVARRLMDALLSGRGDTRALLRGLSRAASERRLLVYSSHPVEERQLADTALGGTLPAGNGPYAFVVVNNLAGSKMDYYLNRTLTYRSDRCAAGRRRSRIGITFTNSAPAPATLPAYVTQRQDTDRATLAQSGARGSVSVLVSIYGPKGAGVLHATVDGHPLRVSSNTEDGRPVWGFPLVIGPGASRTVTLQITEPASNAAPVIPVQPLVRPERVRTSLVRCH